jgi:uncharacterized membrane protein YedE/YeeE
MFTPYQTLLGGYILHLSTSSLLTLTGRVLGISGIVDGAILGDKSRWRWSMIGGMLLGPVVALALGNLGVDDGLEMWAGLPWLRVGVAGLLVGLGSRVSFSPFISLMLINQLGSGCTSGHFLCGVSRLSPRSLVATATFFTTAVITASTFPAPTPLSLSLPIGKTFEPLVKGYELSLPTTKTALTVLATVVASNRAQHALSTYLLTTYPTNARQPPSWMKELPYFISGLVFALGLQISGMLSPLKVISFLQPFSPSFDPSLAMVVVGGVLPNALHYVDLKKEAKLFWEEWRVPNRTDIDWRLIAGSVMFGLGWGLAGVCPGPALVGLSQGVLYGSAGKVTGWLGAMVVGMAIGRQI